MNIRSFLSFSVLFILVAFFMASSVYAQAPPFQDDEVPIDGGISILAGMGALYGAYQVRKNRKKK